MAGVTRQNEGLQRAPKPYDHLIASPVFSINWGRGWLGYNILGDLMQIWFVFEDRSGSIEIEYQDIFTYDDKINSWLWMGFASPCAADGHHDVLLFVLNPLEEFVLFPVPSNLRRFAENYGR